MADCSIYEVKRVRLLSVLKTGMLVSFVLSFLLYLEYWLFLSSLLASSGLAPALADFGLALTGWFSMLMMGVLLSFMSAAFWTLTLLAAALVYNAMTSLMGGVEVEIKDVPEQTWSPKPFPGAPAQVKVHSATLEETAVEPSPVSHGDNAPEEQDMSTDRTTFKPENPEKP